MGEPFADWTLEAWHLLPIEIRRDFHDCPYHRDYVHTAEDKDGIPPELSAAWDRTMARFGL